MKKTVAPIRFRMARPVGAAIGPESDNAGAVVSVTHCPHAVMPGAADALPSLA